MAFVTDTHSSTFSNIWTNISGFFTMVGRAMAMSTANAAEARFRQIELLNAKTDEELKVMNLRREDIPTYVFRDMMHL
ncbi:MULTISPECIES: hypothetical protein [unclassified Tateyamaria]|jgi:hypothetical protein|uniref:hypothetical protein n=1 Tax=unclassified Tateyamaria TaxID=2645127 RepID=UPI000D553292|nr:hypothetical protein [Tateyamaria sp. Alg231-49]